MNDHDPGDEHVEQIDRVTIGSIWRPKEKPEDGWPELWWVEVKAFLPGRMLKYIPTYHAFLGMAASIDSFTEDYELVR